jgi:hypothetical protein
LKDRNFDYCINILIDLCQKNYLFYSECKSHILNLNNKTEMPNFDLKKHFEFSIYYFFMRLEGFIVEASYLSDYYKLVVLKKLSLEKEKAFNKILL